VATFVTLDQAKARLRITSTDEDVDLQLLLDQAEAHVLNWCSVTTSSKTVVDGWRADSATVPDVVVAAILVQTGELDRFRGDDPEGPPRLQNEVLATAVRELLRPYHDAVIA
jgi:gp6-like head-tail connector protein